MPWLDADHVLGVGIDLVDVERFRGALLRRGVALQRRLFLPDELRRVGNRRDPVPALAAVFAAKEAVLKALGTGLAGTAWRDVEIRRRQGRPPEVVLRGPAAVRAREIGVRRVLLSITHTSAMAGAQAVAVGYAA